MQYLLPGSIILNFLDILRTLESESHGSPLHRYPGKSDKPTAHRIVGLVTGRAEATSSRRLSLLMNSFSSSATMSGGCVPASLCEGVGCIELFRHQWPLSHLTYTMPQCLAQPQC